MRYPKMIFILCSVWIIPLANSSVKLPFFKLPQIIQFTHFYDNRDFTLVGSEPLHETALSEFAVTDFYLPRGWMLNNVGLDRFFMTDTFTGNCVSAAPCIQVSWSRLQANEWVGLYWLHPQADGGGNWPQKDQPGCNLTGSTAMTVWARGEKGGETILFHAAFYYGHDVESSPITLTTEWKQYTIDLTGADLTNVVGAFAYYVYEADNTNHRANVTFYLDKIAYQGINSVANACPNTTPTSTSTPIASPTNTPILSPSPTLTNTPPSTPSPTGSPSATPTPMSTENGSQVLLPIVVKPQPTPTAPALPSWQRLSQPQLNVAALARQGDQLFAGERKDTGYPGGLYKRSLATCATTPDLTRFPSIESSVLGLALQGVHGVVAAYDIGMLYTNNGGDTWTQSSSKVSNPRTVEMSSGIIYAATENDGLYYSEDGGITWTPRSGEPKAINVLKIQASTVWIGTDTTGVWKLIAGGSAPVQQNTGLNNNASREIWDLGFAADNMIYLATEDGVYRGTGNTNSPWQPFDIDLKGLRSLEFVGDQLYAGVLHSGVWRHALTGGNWQPVTSPGWNNTLTVRDLFYDANNCHGLLAATNDGIWLYR